MAKATGYSLWLVPERHSRTYDLLSRLIRNVAAHYQTPVFDPHVTLLGGIAGQEAELREKASVLVRKLSPYEMRLGEIDSNGTYFQILFSKVEQAPPVLNANAVAQVVFARNDGGYFPHLSLAYGDLSEKQVGILNRLALQRSPIKLSHFRVQDIELWRTEGAVKEWRQVATFSLENS